MGYILCMPKKKRGRGRPKLPKGVAQTAVLTIRMSKADRRAIHAAARSTGGKLSDWARAVLIRAASESSIEQERRAEELNPIADSSSDPRAV